jgi:hypothetical protein
MLRLVRMESCIPISARNGLPPNARLSLAFSTAPTITFIYSTRKHRKAKSKSLRVVVPLASLSGWKFRQKSNISTGQNMFIRSVLDKHV